MYTASSDTFSDILDYWHQKAAVWPRLSSVARTILDITATETSSERVFPRLVAVWRNSALS